MSFVIKNILKNTNRKNTCYKSEKMLDTTLGMNCKQTL